jgi:DUF1365 family protein
MESCLYFGRVRHRRFAPVAHAFERPLFLVYLDLSELDSVFRGRWLWSTRRLAYARFRREDHLGDPAVPLDESVRRLVGAHLGRRPAGPIRLLTQLRQAGLRFDPVRFFYCFGADARALDAIVADVTNTPWNERHRYVLDARASDGGGRRLRLTSTKEFHVSPFLPMELEYGWSLTAPGERLAVRIEARRRGGAATFDALLALRRREITRASLAFALARFPLLGVQVMASIYWQAFRLHRKGARFFPHPALAGAAARRELESAP